MRIISGIHKGRKIQIPAKLPVRPTTDFARESIFNILTNHFDFEALNILELFAGTGLISFEFASRGAKQITAVDVSNKCFHHIIKTRDILNIDTLYVERKDAFRYLRSLTETYDIIFADPPYDLPRIPVLIDIVIEKELLKPNGWFILEHSKKHDFSSHPNLLDHRKYGDVNFSIFKV